MPRRRRTPEETNGVLEALSQYGDTLGANLVKGGENIVSNLFGNPLSQSVLDVISRPAYAGGAAINRLWEAVQEVGETRGKEAFEAARASGGAIGAPVGLGDLGDVLAQAAPEVGKSVAAETLAPVPGVLNRLPGLESVLGRQAEKVPYEELAFPDNPWAQMALAIGLGGAIGGVVRGGKKAARKAAKKAADPLSAEKFVEATKAADEIKKIPPAERALVPDDPRQLDAVETVSDFDAAQKVPKAPDVPQGVLLNDMGPTPVWEGIDPPPIGAVSREFAEQQPLFRDLPSDVAGSEATMIDHMSATDYVERSSNGLLRREMVRPVEDAVYAARNEEDVWGKNFERLLKDTGVHEGKDSARQVFLKIDVDPETGLSRNTRDLTEKEDELAAYLKNSYDWLLTRVNEKRKLVGLPEIARRSDYINHIWDETVIDLMFGNIHTPQIESMRATAALTGGRKSPFAPFMLHRAGKLGFKEDAVAAFKAYVPLALRQIHMLEPVTKARAYVKWLPPTAQEFYTKWLDTGAFGKRTGVDRRIKTVRPGRSNALARTQMVYEKFAHQVARNLVVGNASTALLQLTSMPQVWAHAGIKASTRAAVDTAKELPGFISTAILNSPVGAVAPIPVQNALKALAFTMSDAGWDFVKKNSKQFRLRELTSFEDVVDPSKFKTFQEILALPMKIADHLTVAYSFNAGYAKAVKELGLQGDDAIRFADDMAARTQAVYDRLWKPAMLRNTVINSSFGQFQVWGTRQMNLLRFDVLRSPDMNTLDKMKWAGIYMGGMLGVNSLMHMLGLRVPWENLAGMVPGGSQLAAIGFPGFTQEPGRTGAPPGLNLISQATKDLYRVGQDLVDDTTTPEQRRAYIERLIRTGAIVGVPAGNMVQKTGFGVRDVLRGYSQRGTKEIPLDAATEKARALLLGPSGTIGARDARETKAPITTIQGILQRIAPEEEASTGRRRRRRR